MKNVEVEIQAFVKNIKVAEKKLQSVGRLVRTRKQTDAYYVPPHKDFFRKDPPEEYLRVREERERNHVNYSFLRFGRDGNLRATDEYETSVGDPKVLNEIFKRIGFIPAITVQKTRMYFDCGNFEVILDRIKNLGNFIEVEAKKNLGGVDKTRKSCLTFLDSLGIEYEIRSEMGYPRMLYKKMHKQTATKRKMGTPKRILKYVPR